MEERKTSRKKFWYNDNTVGYIFSLPFIIGFLAFTLIPIAVSMYYSVTDYKLGQTPAFIGIKNYLELLKDERFINSVKVTLIYVVTSVPTKLIFALFVAYLLTQGRRGVTFYRSLYYVPSLIGGSIAVALVWKTIQGIPADMYEAAEIDGANKWQRFLSITLPCLSPIILYNLVMQTITAFMAFTQAFVITQGGPNDATNFYALYVYNHAFKWSNMGYASAMSWLMLVLISVITLILFKSSKFWVFSEADQ